MTHFTLTKNWERSLRSNYTLELRDETDTLLSSCGLQKIKTAFGDTFVDTLCFGGVATPLQHRRKGYGEALVRAALEHASNVKIYSHVSKKNTASLRTHEKCGFREILDYAVYADGSVNDASCTLCVESK